MTKKVSERELVLEVLLAVTRDKEYSHIALQQVLSKYQYLEKRERAFVTRVAEGTLEHLIEMDYIINQFSKVPVNKMKPVIRCIFRSAVYQMKYMDAVPMSAACNEAVKLAVSKGFGSLKGFVNGVLRNIGRGLNDIKWPDEKDILPYLSVKYSMPEWILEKWLKEYDRNTVEGMLREFLKEKPVTVRCNLNSQSVESLIERLKAEGAQAELHPYLPYAVKLWDYDYLGALETFREGRFQVQDISSMLVTEAASPTSSDYVIDVCAAPGGKAVHMAEKTTPDGFVEARDLTDYKVDMIRENIERLGLKNIRAVKMDATVYDDASREKADIVIADLPCSGLGVLGKKTDLKYNMTLQMQQGLVELQRQILTTIRNYVKPGGTLVYSTCTINEDENMGNVRWFLNRFPEFTVEPVTEFVCESLRQSVKDGCLQLLPGIHECDGFFLARFRKKD